MLPILTIMHPLVDACSMGVLAVGGMAVERILLYNALAFALQLPLGVVADARPRLSAAGFSLGVGLVCAATLAAALGAGGWGVLSAACFGNALFHLTAGKHVLDAHGGRSGPAGLFISTGALGLLAGRLGVDCVATEFDRELGVLTNNLMYATEKSMYMIERGLPQIENFY